MSKPRFVWWRNPFFLGLVGGWLVGMLWWAGLMIAFGPSTIVTLEAGQVVERPITLLSRLRYAPVVALPWAFVGLIVGCCTAVAQNRLVAVVACVSLIAGGVGAVATNPFDGWLTIMMPLCCLGGALAGAFITAAVIVLWRLIRTGQV
jgi:hypothetical protein